MRPPPSSPSPPPFFRSLIRSTAVLLLEAANQPLSVQRGAASHGCWLLRCFLFRFAVLIPSDLGDRFVLSGLISLYRPAHQCNQVGFDFPPFLTRLPSFRFPLCAGFPLQREIL